MGTRCALVRALGESPAKRHPLLLCRCLKTTVFHPTSHTTPHRGVTPSFHAPRTRTPVGRSDENKNQVLKREMAAASSSPERRGGGRAAHGRRLVASCSPLLFLFLLLCVASPASEAFTSPASGAGMFLLSEDAEEDNQDIKPF